MDQPKQTYICDYFIDKMLMTREVALIAVNEVDEAFLENICNTIRARDEMIRSFITKWLRPDVAIIFLEMSPGRLAALYELVNKSVRLKKIIKFCDFIIPAIITASFLLNTVVQHFTLIKWLLIIDLLLIVMTLFFHKKKSILMDKKRAIINNR